MRKSILIYLTFVVFILAACRENYLPENNTVSADDCNVSFRISLPEYSTRSVSPDENKLSDLNIFIFDKNGQLEEKRYVMTGGSQECVCDFSLLKNKDYDVYICANILYELKITSLEDVKNFRHYLAYPDDYKGGIPMSARVENLKIQDALPAGSNDENPVVNIKLQRTMARLRLTMDRSSLESDVRCRVHRVRVCNCPNSVLMFGENRIQTMADVFSNGFTRTEYDSEVLNSDSPDGKSLCLDLYMLENLQAENLNRYCSYIEMDMSYESGSLYTEADRFIRYRFYLGDNRKDFNVRRNCSYAVTVKPVGQGLGEQILYEDGRGSLDWRIDRSELKKFVSSVTLSKEKLQFSYVGEESYLYATVLPEDAGNTTLEWVSSNNAVAAVDVNGRVTARGNGDCVISCYSTDGSECKAECRVEVAIKPAWVKFHPVGYIEVDLGDILEVGCDFFPPNMDCRIDEEDLLFDAQRGIYTYELNENGSKAKLKITGEGSGMFRYVAREPLDTSALVFIHVRPAEKSGQVCEMD